MPFFDDVSGCVESNPGVPRHRRDVVPVTAPMQPNSLVDSTQVEGNIEELRAALRQAADPMFPAGAVRQTAPLHLVIGRFVDWPVLNDLDRARVNLCARAAALREHREPQDGTEVPYVGATARLYELELARDDAFGFFERTTHRKVPLLEGYPEESLRRSRSGARPGRGRRRRTSPGHDFLLLLRAARERGRPRQVGPPVSRPRLREPPAAAASPSPGSVLLRLRRREGASGASGGGVGAVLTRSPLQFEARLFLRERAVGATPTRVAGAETRRGVARCDRISRRSGRG